MRFKIIVNYNYSKLIFNTLLFCPANEGDSYYWKIVHLNFMVVFSYPAMSTAKFILSIINKRDLKKYAVEVEVVLVNNVKC